MAGTLTRVPTMVPNIHRNVDGEVAYAASAIYRLANDYTLKPSLLTLAPTYGNINDT